MISGGDQKVDNVFFERTDHTYISDEVLQS